MAFFTCLSLFTLTLGIIVGTPVIIEFYQTKYITKVPSTALASSLSYYFNYILVYWTNIGYRCSSTATGLRTESSKKKIKINIPLRQCRL